MSIKISQLQNFALNGSGVSISDTTMTLSSFQTIDGVNLAMTDFGSKGYMTIEPGSRDREEQISFTGVTQNSSGTATLTGIKTVLFLSPYTETSGFSKSHPGGVVAVVTNTSGFYNEFGIKENSEVLTGYWEAPDPLTTQGIATKNYVDSLVNGGTVTTNALIEVATAGETVSAGQVLYLKSADGRWWKADATTSATLFNVQLGIAQGAGTAGNVITGGVLIRGIDSNQSGIVAGSIYYVRDGGGLPTATAGTISRMIGNGGVSATKLAFDPSMYSLTRESTSGGIVGVVPVTNGYDGFLDRTFSKQPTLTKFLASGTWTKPVGLKYVIVEGVGGGGGGGGGEATNTPHVGGGGGYGGYAKKMILAATLGATETVTIGAGGTAGSPPGGGGASTGGTGGTTSFGSHISCLGGVGGIHTQVLNTLGTGGLGGVASNGDINITGESGYSGAISASAAGVPSGRGGSGILGAGGASKTADGAGNNAIGYGAGGSGACSTSGNGNGGTGSVGFVGVMEFYL